MKNILWNKTKIIATIGPSSSTKKRITELIHEGADIFRLNFSHGTHEEHAKVIRYIREVNAKLGTQVGILQDLQGPKIRLGEIEKKVRITAGDPLTITTTDRLGTKDKVSTSYKNLPSDVKKGDSILIDDGKIELKVTSVRGKEVHTTVIYGGKLRSRKGINLPTTNVSAPSLTPKDLKDLQFGFDHNLEWVALSFVRRPADCVRLRKLIDRNKKQTLIVAKIEKPEAVRNFDGILKVCDGVMVARGDLGVEIGSEDVPMIQKTIVGKCRRAAKPVIIATQMMESMIESPRPTRAETNDVANAVLDGADALMLSAETAAGAYPVEVVRSMVKTIHSVEAQGDIYYKLPELDESSEFFLHDSVVRVATRVAEYTDAKALVTLTHRGYAPFRLSSYRPKASIFIFTHNEPFINSMNLLWGVRSFYYDKSDSTDATIADLNAMLKKKGHVRKNDTVIFLVAMPINKPGKANTIHVSQVK